MVFIKLITSLVLSLLLFSCSSVIEELSKENLALKPIPQSLGYCSEKKSATILVGKDKVGVRVFQTFLNQVEKRELLNRFEKIVAWSLYQMNQRPDLATPSARFQLVLKTKEGIQYWDFKDSSLDQDIPKSFPPMSFLYGLETILKTYSPKSSLLSVAYTLDRILPTKVPISADFAQFLETHKAQLLKTKVFEKAFFKAKEPLRFGESITRLPYSKIIKQYYKNKKRASFDISTSNQLFSYKLPGTPNDEALCSIDITAYENNEYKISSDDKEKHHPFAIQFSKDSFFIGITSIASLNFRSMLGSYLIEATQNNLSTPLCYTESKDNAHVYLSFRGRDPGQHLFNLFQYNIHLSDSPEELDQYLKFPRHLILTKPLRLLYESSRSTPKDLENFLLKNIPVYHSPQLGEMWLYSQKAGFIIDDRGKAHLSCMK